MSPIKGFSCIDVGTEPLYVDTVILITLFTNYCTHPFGTEVQKIFDNLIISGTSFTTSALTCDEVPSAIRAALLEAARRNKNPNEPSYSKYFLDADPSILKQVDEISSRVLEDFENLGSEYLPYVLIPKLAKIERRFSAAINIDLNDAKHLISAKSYGVSHFITCDRDYAKVSDPTMNIYLPDRMAASVSKIVGNPTIIPDIN